MEEIDIIELLKRVKEGKAPKKIEIHGFVYIRNDAMKNNKKLDSIYYSEECGTCWDIYFDEMRLDTKIKILDKPTIEELPNDINLMTGESARVTISNKINEIIKWINNKE